MATDFLAGAQVDSPFAPLQLFAGSLPVNTHPAVLVSGQNLLANTVVSRITASGKITQWAPAASDGSEKVVGVMLHAIDASGGDKQMEIYNSGSFNTLALVWPGGVTAAQQERAFDGTKMEHRKLGYSG